MPKRELYADQIYLALERYKWAFDELKIDFGTLIERAMPLYGRGMPLIRAFLETQAPMKDLYTVAYMANNSISSFCQIDPQNINLALYENIDLAICEKLGFCITSYENNVVEYAFSNPMFISQIDARITQIFLGASTKPLPASKTDIEAAIISLGVRLSEAKAVKLSDSLNSGIEGSRVDNTSATIVRSSEEALLVQQIIETSYRMRASDLHFDPTPFGLKVRYRVDGVLNDHASPIPMDVGRKVLNYIKTRAGLETALNLGPQDGRFSMLVDGKNIDFRVGTITTSQEVSKITLRILTSATMSESLDSLGYDQALLDSYKSLLSLNSGLILVTGPVGSGKTTTLYTSLHHMYKPSIQIMSVEDPVEYEMQGINQIPIQRNMTFATALRALVRHDFDVLMIGEIRDQPTAAISVESAITGRLIMSSLHTPDSPTAPIRLRNMGIEPYQISTALKGVLAQRLVRELCSCKIPMELIPNSINWPNGKVPEVIYKAKGCLTCNNTGYLGRFAVGELLVVDEEMSALLASTNVNARDIRFLAQKNGLVPMQDSALRRVAKGDTSLEEVTRVFSFSVDNSDEDFLSELKREKILEAPMGQAVGDESDKESV